MKASDTVMKADEKINGRSVLTTKLPRSCSDSTRITSKVLG